MKKRILVVDDSAPMRMLLSLTLKKNFAAHHIAEAVDGTDALTKLEEHEYDLMLTDMMMPRLDGAQLIARVRNDLRRDMPIIIVTTNGAEEDRDRGMTLGANGYITKPIRVPELKEIVEEMLDAA